MTPFMDAYRHQVEGRFHAVDRRLDRVGAMGTAMAQMSANTSGLSGRIVWGSAPAHTAANRPCPLAISVHSTQTTPASPSAPRFPVTKTVSVSALASAGKHRLDRLPSRPWAAMVLAARHTMSPHCRSRLPALLQMNLEARMWV